MKGELSEKRHSRMDMARRGRSTGSLIILDREERMAMPPHSKMPGGIDQTESRMKAVLSGNSLVSAVASVELAHDHPKGDGEELRFAFVSP